MDKLELFDFVIFVAQAINILVLLTTLNHGFKNNFFFKSKKGWIPDNMYLPTTLAWYHNIVAKNGLLIHSFSDCETFNMAKTKFTSKLEINRNSFENRAFPMSKSTSGTRGWTILQCCYGDYKHEQSINVLRFKVFNIGIFKATCNLASLPPTQNAARLHKFTVFHQTHN